MTITEPAPNETRRSRPVVDDPDASTRTEPLVVDGHLVATP